MPFKGYFFAFPEITARGEIIIKKPSSNPSAPLVHLLLPPSFTPINKDIKDKEKEVIAATWNEGKETGLAHFWKFISQLNSFLLLTFHLAISEIV